MLRLFSIALIALAEATAARDKFTLLDVDSSEWPENMQDSTGYTNAKWYKNHTELQFNYMNGSSVEVTKSMPSLASLTSNRYSNFSAGPFYLALSYEVLGGAPVYEDEWAAFLQIHTHSRGTIQWVESGTGTQLGENKQRVWSLDGEQVDDIAFIRLTLWGNDAENWAGFYGPIFRNIELSLITGNLEATLTNRIEDFKPGWNVAVRE